MKSTNLKSGLLMLVFLLGMACPAGAVEFWDITEVDTWNGFSSYRSVVILSSGQPAIGYYDGTSENLWYAWYDGSMWHKEVVDNATDVGKYTSLGILPSGCPAISYYDYANRDLKYALYDGNTWQMTTVDSNLYRIMRCRIKCMYE